MIACMAVCASRLNFIPYLVHLIASSYLIYQYGMSKEDIERFFHCAKGWLEPFYVFAPGQWFLILVLWTHSTAYFMCSLC